MSYVGSGPCACGARLENIPLVRVLYQDQDGVSTWLVEDGHACSNCGRALRVFESAPMLEIPARRVEVECGEL